MTILMNRLTSFLLIGAASLAPAAYSKSPRPVGESMMRQVLVENIMACGPAKVQLATRFQEVDEDTGHAVAQTLTVTSDTRHVIKFSYRPFEQGIYDDSMVSEVQCLHTRENRWILKLNSTNYGNCAVCEWSDYFDVRGTYIGSTRAQFGAVGFNYQKLNSRDSAVLDSAKPFGTQSSIHVTRALN